MHLMKVTWRSLLIMAVGSKIAEQLCYNQIKQLN